MTEFTVEVYGNAIKNESEWTQWRHATDVVPGTILLEDSGEPCLIFPIEATALNEAAIFAQGVMASLGLTIVWGRAYPAEDNAVITTSVNVPDFVPAWLLENELVPA